MSTFLLNLESNLKLKKRALPHNLAMFLLYKNNFWSCFSGKFHPVLGDVLATDLGARFGTDFVDFSGAVIYIILYII